ncbi:DEAD/DEAH box helicase family protein [Pseudomonas mosselii]|uniref:type I restriction endonuclease subunit R n=1 Tax=Pseudomonas mosselii TaxID=78327 RepID=UPI00244CD72B|nr:type I restriction endonuclease [Pseudomonas mosselii]MDH0629545.1 DEAD/DEAH box helicase family protein [Pseudomonas mosselii]MDH0680475.1 DEAD/DEAH box helicase family protein [Pseudomonas mosselii]MDH0927061.1 DEAD/DEAH box helicase family protein [Pseudomonas mosselii]MDH1136314.1 DEAD/DEAH box helicase family protein [Pseudomonas mosselii]MDH1141153.1 DEAD/DEAH box helicase family protein [Pseudomonas mosselii]
MKSTSEAAFETAIEAVLLASNYSCVDRKGFDRERAIFPDEALAFIRATQGKVWEKLENLHGEQTGARVLESLVKWLDSHGALATLRHGFKCFGKTLRIAFFRPAHGLNPELEARYQANRLGLTRQLHFSPKNEKSLDVVLSLNGIPLVTLELKNPLSGQTAASAIHQYRHDRDPREPIFVFSKRTLVHFAVDTEEAHMATRLAGTSTYFLPFNRGFEGGDGNPPDPDGRNYKTAYLWEEVLQRDSLLDLLARFLHLRVEEKTTSEGKKVRKDNLIFPRYHQLQAVRAMVLAAAREGVGYNYLVEHSAGSGKSNTIAWLAHRLSSLHNHEDERLFDSVVVITDRVVLDRQLQNTIYQFDHRQGVVQKVDEDSRQLAEALEAGVPIIITTLQKFPFVSAQLARLNEERSEASKSYLPARKYAVIIDEAHSSQSGETATELKGVLGGSLLRDKAQEMAREEGEAELEKLFRSMAKRGQQPNMSFFAFTATPKHKTLAIFGRNEEPFHRYTMRQAIQEGFIEDVLKSYVTYKTYYKLIKKAEEDPSVERKKAAKALARFMRLHPHNIGQKTEVMVEHFQHFTRHKIGGHAKAMVVTGSRLEAVRYKQEFDCYIKAKGYPIKSLVAFSGSVEDDKIPEMQYTEVEMNDGLKEKDLPETFTKPDFRVLLVAEKYQTGFDQPLLHTLYVDKRLSGIQAVQTLSRLNRTHPLKDDTFVLDFVNDPCEIQEAFRQYYEGSVMGEEVDPDKLYEVKAELDASGIYLQGEVADFTCVFFAPKLRQSPSDHKTINAILDRAVTRFVQFQASEEEEAELWRGKLQAFRNLYSFLSQVIPYQDSDLEKLFTYLRHLALKLPKRKSGPGYQFDEEVELDYYRLQKISEGSISLNEGYAKPLDGPCDVGSGIVREEHVPLSRLVDIINQRFGNELNEADQLFFEQIAEAASLNESLRKAAEVNSIDKFQLVFRQVLESLFIERMELNEELFTEYMVKPELQELISKWLGSQVYARLSVASKLGS